MKLKRQILGHSAEVCVEPQLLHQLCVETQGIGTVFRLFTTVLVNVHKGNSQNTCCEFLA